MLQITSLSPVCLGLVQDAYFLKDSKTATTKLNSDMDEYWKAKKKAEDEGKKDEAETEAEPAAAE